MADDSKEVGHVEVYCACNCMDTCCSCWICVFFFKFITNYDVYERKPKDETLSDQTYKLTSTFAHKYTHALSSTIYSTHTYIFHTIQRLFCGCISVSVCIRVALLLKLLDFRYSLNQRQKSLYETICKT